MTPRAGYRVVLLAAALFVAWTLFWQLTLLLLALLLTIIVALPLTAATDWFARHGVPRSVGAVGTMVLALAALAGFGVLLAPTLVAQVDRALAELPAVIDRVATSLGLGTSAAGAGFEVRTFLEGYVNEPARLIGRVRDVVSSLAAVVGGLLLVLFTAIYAAANPRPLVHGAVRLIPPEHREHARYILGRLRRSWLGWLKGTAIDMVLTGALTYVALSLLGIRHALVFALLTALLEVVPYLGPMVAAIPPVLYALTQSVELAVATLAVYTLIQQIEGHLIVPLVMSQAVELHPALLAFGVVVIGQLLGLLGILLAVPILAAIVVLIEELWVLPCEARKCAAGPPPGAVTADLAASRR